MAACIDDLSRELRPPLTAEAALVEADRCLECGGLHAPAPCVVGCPADVDVPALRRGDRRRTIPRLPRGRSSPRTSSAGPARASARSRCSARALASWSTRDGRRSRSARSSATRPSGRYAHGVPLRPAADANGRRVAVVGAGPAGLAAAGELAARGYAVTVYDEREEVGGLVRYAIAPYRQTNEPLPDEARLLARARRRVQPRHASRTRRTCSELEAEVDAIVLAVGMGADARRRRTRATTSTASGSRCRSSRR